MTYRTAPYVLGRIAALVALATAPLLAAALVASAWTAASDLGLPSATLSDAIVTGAAALGAIACAVLTGSTVLAVAAPTGSRVRAAALRAMPHAWRRLVAAALGGAVAAGLTIPAVAAPGAGWLDPAAESTGATGSTTIAPAAWTRAASEGDPGTSPARVPEASLDAPPGTTPDDRLPPPHDPRLAGDGAGWLPAAAAAPTAEAATTTDPPADPSAITVETGDSLWSITARERGGSAADVARAWPDLYALNREVVGADPDLIHAGQRLALPEEWSR
ncbi:LysM peptidoglycan-binding domain-containing protein [Demequina sp. NBRC 110056]|uniref:LysM peptidoglycan-binding domain-containing protein n=1 Tax=Demequina sp. NBRC 110056 TaxID=1570345 RepID=UPI000A04474E|nr:LysM domain-containing protein [Demequina sp. NBRC 110056]